MNLQRKRNNGVRATRSFSGVEQAILTTILYADIFTAPLTRQELWTYIISEKKIEKRAFDIALKNLTSLLIWQEGFVALKDAQSVIQKRVKNRSEVQRKLSLAHNVASLLSTIPTIQCIGVSGGLAAENIEANDDIDLFVIVQKGTLYKTRFWILTYLACIGKRRTRLSKKTKDLFCVNLLIDQSETRWPKEKRDIYTAREIAQINPLFQRKNMYQQFLKDNSWITHFLPNALQQKRKILPVQSFRFFALINHFLLGISSETFLRAVQHKIMMRHKTSETVTNSQLAFHPKDYRAETLRNLKLKMRQFGLLTKF